MSSSETEQIEEQLNGVGELSLSAANGEKHEDFEVTLSDEEKENGEIHEHGSDDHKEKNEHNEHHEEEERVP